MVSFGELVQLTDINGNIKRPSSYVYWGQNQKPKKL